MAREQLKKDPECGNKTGDLFYSQVTCIASPSILLSLPGQQNYISILIIMQCGRARGAGSFRRSAGLPDAARQRAQDETERRRAGVLSVA